MLKKEAVFISLVFLFVLFSFSFNVDALTCQDVGYCSGLPHSSQGSSTARDSQGNIYCYYKAVVSGASGCAGRTCYEGTKVICNPPNTCTATGCQTGGCTPNWQCANWGTCGFDGFQSRSCSDTRNCGTTSGGPELSQRCTPGQPTPSPTPTPAPTQPAAAPSATGLETCYERNIGERCVDLCNAKGQTCVYNNKFSDQPCSKGKGAGSLGATGGSEFNVLCTRAPAGDVGKCAYWCAGTSTATTTTGEEYKHIGCFGDGPTRAIPGADNYGYDNSNYQSKPNAIKDCANFAKSKGWDTFAVQHGGWCATGPNAGSTYNKYGNKDYAGGFIICSGGKGGGWANDVYQFSTTTATTTTAQTQPAKKTTVQLAKKVVSCEGIYDLYPVGKPDAKVDLNDFFEFALKYGNKDLTVDYRRDNVLDFDDFVCFKQQFGGVPTVTPKDCLGLNGNQELDPDYNNDGKIDDADLTKFYQCGNFFTKNSLFFDTPSKEICRKFDFDNDGKVDFSGSFYDGACFSVFYKQNLNCKGSSICSDADRSGEIDFQDVFSFINCFESRSGDCLSKFDYSGNREVDAMDYLCLKKDFGKAAKDVSICIPGMACRNDNECGPLGSDFYCSFGDKGKKPGNEIGGCCNRKRGEVWDGKICRGATELECKCPFEQEEGTGRFKGSGGYITSKDFVNNAACKTFEKVCVLTKRFTRQDAPKEKRKVTVEVYRKK